MLDDTSYFLPCRTQGQAECAAAVLNSPPAQEFFRAFVFWDSKRPITGDLLRRLDLRKAAEEVGALDEFQRHFPVEGAAVSRRLREPQLWLESGLQADAVAARD